MYGRAAAIAGFLLAMIAGAAPAALAQADDWEQVPSASALAGGMPGAPPGAGAALGGMLGSAAAKANLGCEMAGRLAQAAGKARDRGQSEQSQLGAIDDPHGTLHRLAAASRLPAGTATTLGAAMHREIAYAYAHPELTPAQLKAHFRQECASPPGGGK